MNADFFYRELRICVVILRVVEQFCARIKREFCCFIHVQDAHMSDNGTYLCNAVNKLGHDSADAFLIVRGMK